MWRGRGGRGLRVEVLSPQEWAAWRAVAPRDGAVLADVGAVEHRHARDAVLAADDAWPVLMVARSDRPGVSAALAALTALRRDGWAGGAALVVCDAGGSAAGVVRSAARLAAAGGVPVAVLPWLRDFRRSPLPVGRGSRRSAAGVTALVGAWADAAAAGDVTPGGAAPRRPATGRIRIMTGGVG